MSHSPSIPPRIHPGQKIAVLSPSMAGPAYGEAIHDQAMKRLAQLSGHEVVEFPTTRKLGATSQERAADLNAAFADPSIGVIMATVGGNDQITVLPYLDTQAIRAHPTAFVGYSDNTHLHNWLWRQGIASFYGGSTQVQLGPGPKVDEIHRLSLLSIFRGGEVELFNPGESEDHGLEWSDPRALTEYGQRVPVDSWQWFGPQRKIQGPTWGGCVQVLWQVLVAGHTLPDEAYDGGILLLEFSDNPVEPLDFANFLRALGERGLLRRFAGVVLARIPASSLGWEPPVEVRHHYRDTLVDLLSLALERYAPEAVFCSGIPFGHTRPQWIIPYGGSLTLDGETRRVFAHYGSIEERH
ncbi:LD-carboxypeptidase [Corynebacterium sp. 3HC-13]|uniref:S66 family peptidase n=1 Tax=Corynebacterium poyangense TaxID=2684405 RepID=UPI001CCB6236|nr:S66 peptidase family protein [Corynebacterium poyangense]MBZ8177480.1 LD-carboxypeptidase [Corynebacterium poyangense]